MFFLTRVYIITEAAILMMEFEVWIAAFQVLILEPSKVLQPAIVCVSEEDESCTVQLKHVTLLKVCRHSVMANPRAHSLIWIQLNSCNEHRMQNRLYNKRKNQLFSKWLTVQWMFNQESVWVCSLSVTVCDNDLIPQDCFIFFLLRVYVHVQPLLMLCHV